MVLQYLIMAVLAAFAILFLKRSVEVGIGPAGTEVGGALGSLGAGGQSFLTGIGTGISKLFNPLFTLKDLVYGTGSLNVAQTAGKVNSQIVGSQTIGTVVTSKTVAQQTNCPTCFQGVTSAGGEPATFNVQKSGDCYTVQLASGSYKVCSGGTSKL